MRIPPLVAALMVAGAASALWVPPAGAKGFPFGRDIRIACDARQRAELADRQTPTMPALPRERVRRALTVVGCAVLPNGAGTVQLTAAPRAPWRGCVLDSYTVGHWNGGILCAHFREAFSRGRNAVGLWITRLTRDGPAVALGAAAAPMRDLYLWYSHGSGLPGLAPLARIPVGPALARQLGAPARFTYLAAGLPPDTDLCDEALIEGRGPGGSFGPAPFLDTGIITRTEGDGGLTETPLSPRCTGRSRAGGDLPTVARALTAALTLFR